VSTRAKRMMRYGISLCKNRPQIILNEQSQISVIKTATDSNQSISKLHNMTISNMLNYVQSKNEVHILPLRMEIVGSFLEE
jgi:hypothetical protein